MALRGAVERVLDTIRRGDAYGYASMFAEDAELEHPLAPEPLRGRDAIREGEQALFDAFSDIDVELRTATTEGDRVVAEVVLRATHTGSVDLGDDEPLTPTGRRIAIPAVWIFDFGAGGLVRSERDYFDAANLMSQLGVAG